MQRVLFWWQVTKGKGLTYIPNIPLYGRSTGEPMCSPCSILNGPSIIDAPFPYMNIHWTYINHGVDIHNGQIRINA